MLFIRWTFGPEQDSGGATIKAFNDMFSSDFRRAFRPGPGRDPGEFKCQVMAIKEPKGLEEHFTERYLICKCFMLKFVKYDLTFECFQIVVVQSLKYRSLVKDV